MLRKENPTRVRESERFLILLLSAESYFSGPEECVSVMAVS